MLLTVKEHAIDNCSTTMAIVVALSAFARRVQGASSVLDRQKERKSRRVLHLACRMWDARREDVKLET